MSVTPETEPVNRNAGMFRGHGLAGGAWMDRLGWCERADLLPTGYDGLYGHYHCEACGVCLLKGDHAFNGARNSWHRDARYCSSACRQAAYRVREAA